jgi:hypothetical protein
VFEAWEWGSDGVNPAVAGVEAYEAEDSFASHEVEDSAAEEGEEGFVVPFFADQEAGGVVREGRRLSWLGEVLLVSLLLLLLLMAFGSVC